jgi:type VI secretion system secreted protein VgrG
VPVAAELLGKKYTLVLHDQDEGTVTLRGPVVHASVAASANGGANLELTLGSPVAPLRLGRDSRVFQEMTVVDIVSDVLDRGGVTDVEWRTSAAFAERPYCAQYRESDWSFIERLLAEEGIYYWFEHGEDVTTLVLGDDSTSAEDLDGGAELPYRDASGMESAGPAVTDVTRRASMAHEAVRLRDYNFDKPKLTLDEKAGEGPFELYDAPGRFALPADGKRLAGVRLESLRARRVIVAGHAITTRLRPGRVLEIIDHPVEALNGRYLVESVVWRAAEQRGTAEGGTLQVSWTAIPADTPYRAPMPAMVTRDPGGPETGFVVGAPGEEIHTDPSGRIRVQHYWDRQGDKTDKASTWMRVGQFALGGSMVLPRIGWDVIVHHHEGDIDAPFVSGHLYDGQFPVPYALPANKTRTAWQTATTPGGGSTNEVRFEDKKGGEELFINASKNMDVVIGNDKGEKVGVDHTETIGANLQAKVGSNRKTTVVSNQDVSIGASESLTISGNRSVGVTGAESVTIGGSRSVTATMGSSVDAKGGRTHTVGGTMTAVSALGVSRMVLGTMSATVGGSWIGAAASGLGDMTGGAGALTVGGARIHAGAAGCSTSVKGAAAETVGGAYVITTGGDAAETATGRMAITVGGAFLGNAPTIEVEGDSEISIRCGGSSLTIKSSSIEVKAPTILVPGATVRKKASKVEHN